MTLYDDENGVTRRTTYSGRSGGIARRVTVPQWALEDPEAMALLDTYRTAQAAQRQAYMAHEAARNAASDAYVALYAHYLRHAANPKRVA